MAETRRKNKKKTSSTKKRINKERDTKTIAIEKRSSTRNDKNQQTNKVRTERPVALATQQSSNKNNKKTKKQAKSTKNKTSKKNIMVILMIAYAIVIGVIGIWAFSNFFFFYFTEKSPVMGVNTPSSRVANTPKLSSGDMQNGTNAVIAIGDGIERITIHQVGPTIHFYVVVSEGTDLTKGRELGHKAIVTFADTIGQPELFETYEAQIIVTKENLPVLDENVILRPAENEGPEQQFPQYGVSNKHTNGANKEISWSNNGV